MILAVGVDGRRLLSHVLVEGGAVVLNRVGALTTRGVASRRRGNCRCGWRWTGVSCDGGGATDHRLDLAATLCAGAVHDEEEAVHGVQPFAAPVFYPDDTSDPPPIPNLVVRIPTQRSPFSALKNTLESSPQVSSGSQNMR
ncbi:uncharacterized protein LOC131006539 isoform X2 [Salvia miltiorrhiza]|uniref:uncharacterized protein LOC131006539 isoform X2 n=1 Tax=Salvia miltiorrhiza TaxID=226208 RepID=UPI0025ACFC4B|nr:uncharacterized protein LOC131006539 isoform X2 [Salvia miltiorrhiza]